MQNAYHALEMFEAPISEIRDSIRHWLAETGFRVASASPSDFGILARRGSALGVTDEQTGRIMEVILREAGGFTAVSIFHHTSGVGLLVGATFGDILRDEVNALLESLSTTVVGKR